MPPADPDPRTRRRLALCAVVCMCLAAACGRSERDPVQVVEAFLAAARMGDSRAAVGLLSADTAAALERRIQQAREAAGIADDTPAQALLREHFQLRLARRYNEARRVRPEGGDDAPNRAFVAVGDHRGNEERYELRLEDGRWRIVLPLPVESPAPAAAP